MLAVWSFFISASLVAVMLGFKYWEYSRGRRVAELWRRHLDRRTLYMQHYLTHDIPHYARSALRQSFLYISHRVTEVLLIAVRKMERRLIRLVDMVKGRKRIEKNGRPASDFLNGVVEHKRNGNGRNEKMHSDI